MPFLEVSEVLERLRDLHQQLRDCYERLEQVTSDERLRLMLVRMSAHEDQLDAGLRRYRRDADPAIRKTWVQYMGDSEVRRAIAATDIDEPGLDAAQIVERARALDHAMDVMVEGLASSLTPPRVRDVFGDLFELQEALARERSNFLNSMDEA